MSGDYSRERFDPRNHFSGVLMQQGRVSLDADWNEMVSIFERQLRAETVDIIGRCVVPRETPDGFGIEISGTGNAKSLLIGRGRMYVDGLLAENHGSPPLTLDLNLSTPAGEGPLGVLAQSVGSATDYEDQPHFPAAPDLPAGDGPHLVYLDVWRREVTSVENEHLLEEALGGVDTTNRVQTVWQVKVLPEVGTDVTCSTPDAQVEGWLDLTAPSAGLLSTRVVTFDNQDDPCLLSPGGGYSGLENQLYRVEIHDDGPPGTGTFKWSRDNASISSTIQNFAAADRIDATRVGRDDVLRFKRDDWVEITDDFRELRGEVGAMRRIADISEDLRQIVLSSALPADLIPSGTGSDTPVARHSRIRKWDQRGEVRDTGGTLVVDLDDEANGGVIPIPTAGNTIELEKGVLVTFDVEPADGRFRAMDHWMFAARTADRSLEVLDRAPPRGIHHHYCRLAVVTFPSTVSDCRTFWPLELDGQACGGCSVCVTPESHNRGTLTIQNAVNQVQDTGGTVCLAPGNYTLGDTPVELQGARSIRVVGQGYRTLLSYSGAGAAINVRDCTDIRLSDVGIVVAAPSSDAGVDEDGVSALSLRNCFGARVNGIAAMVIGGRENDRAIELTGYQFGIDLSENAILAPRAIVGIASGETATIHAPYLLLAHVLIRDNLIACQRSGIQLHERTLFVGDTRLTGNTVIGGDVSGIIASGLTAPGGRIDIDHNVLSVNGDGIVTVGDAARVTDNDISAGGKASGSGIVLAGSDATDAPGGNLVAGNRISGVRGHGILITGHIGSCIVKQNLIHATGDAALFMDIEASAAELVVENNVISDIAREFEDKTRSLNAVRVHSAERVVLAANTIDGLAEEGPVSTYRAAIEVIGCRSAVMIGNAIACVGPPRAVGDSVGILVRAPLDSVRVAGNTLRRAPSESAARDPWYAIKILGGDVARDADLRTPLVLADDGASYILTGRGVRILTEEVPRTSLSLTENLVDAVGSSPLVDVGGGHHCVFSANQCLLGSDSDAPAVVVLRSVRLIASNNDVRRPSDADAIHIAAGGKAFTVLGNITFGGIRVQAPDGTLDSLPDPWNALNVLSP